MACSSNAAMVKSLCAEGVLTSPEVIEAFRSVDRGDFVPSSGRFGADRAYANVPVRIGNFHLSAPFIYGVALEALGVRRGVRFINVGSGTGYLSSIVAVLLGGTGTNHGVEARDELVGFARRRVPSAEFLLGNALSLDPVSSRGAYDRVFVGAGCDAARASHFALLLKVGGVLVGPVENELLRIERFSTHVFSSATLMSVKFSPLLVPSPRAADDGTRPLAFALEVWSPKSSRYYPPTFREIAKLLIDDVDLPLCLWYEVLSFMRHDWFLAPEAPPPAKRKSLASAFCAIS